MPTPAGVPQGSPLSPLLYMYYNANLLDIPRQDERGLGFIEDIMYGVEGKLERLLQEAEEWRKRHSAQFEPTKYVLVHFTRNHRRARKAAITVEGSTIESTNEVKYLCVISDQKLQFRTHL